MTDLSISIDSPVGPLTVTERRGALVELAWRARENGDTSLLLDEARRQLEAYFAGALAAFDLPVAPEGTPHQRKVSGVLEVIQQPRLLKPAYSFLRCLWIVPTIPQPT